MKNVYESVGENKIKSTFVVLGFFVFFALAVYILSKTAGYMMDYELGGLGYIGIALIVSGITSFFSYYFSDKIVLSISKARSADRNQDFVFYTVAENIALGSGLPTPKLYVIDDSAPNAFATGRNPENSAVVVTRGLLDKLNRSELEGVIAHELSHIKNYDVRLQTIVAVLVGTIALLSDWMFRVRYFSHKRDSEGDKVGAIFLLLGIVFALLSPFIAQVIQLAISRRREFLADAGSAFITRQPQGLISALEKISADHEPLEVANKATAHMYIANPFKDKVGKGIGTFSKLFNTHPPVEDRISALKSML